MLRSRGITLAGVVYTGPENVASEQAIEELSGVKVLGRVGEMETVSAEGVVKMAEVLRGVLDFKSQK